MIDELKRQKEDLTRAEETLYPTIRDIGNALNGWRILREGKGTPYYYVSAAIPQDYSDIEDIYFEDIIGPNGDAEDVLCIKWETYGSCCGEWDTEYAHIPLRYLRMGVHDAISTIVEERAASKAANEEIKRKKEAEWQEEEKQKQRDELNRLLALQEAGEI